MVSLHEARGLTALILGMLAAGAALISLVASGTAEPLLISALGVLAMTGLFFLFAFAAGHVRIGARTSSEATALAVTCQIDEALYLISPDGAVVWSNPTGGQLLNTAGAAEISDLVQGLGATQPVAEALFRLTRAAEAGHAHHEMVPVKPAGDALGARENVRWVRASVRPIVSSDPSAGGGAGSMVLWRVGDVTAERAVQDHAIRTLHRTLSGYDGIPIGLGTVSADGLVTHMNERLSSWIGFDNKDQAVARGLKLADLVTADGAELIFAMTRRHRDGVRRAAISTSCAKTAA